MKTEVPASSACFNKVEISFGSQQSLLVQDLKMQPISASHNLSTE